MSSEPLDPLLAPLNENQRQAVQTVDGPLLVLAGAGSGKTRVITHRIAWLVERHGVAPWKILAVTFTNKAAGEMRERLAKLLGPVAADVQVSTFHATGAAILRREAEKVGRTRSFLIYDDSDQLQLLRRALKESGVGDRVKPQLVRHRIDNAKNHGRGPDDLPAPPGDFVAQGVKRAYAWYERLLRASDAFDFGDLVLKVVNLFQKDRETLERYRNRFRYVLVDEFQDTNPVQYDLLRLLCPAGRANLCVVGDDDQSIYRWRGADIANILSFERDFPGAQTVKLERNYRSDGAILDAAYSVISKNTRRKEKRLWTDRPKGAPFDLLFAPDERSEAQQVAGWIRSVAQDGVPLSEVAVFYRVNAQSRVLEEGLRLAGVPYHVVRGRAFYDRAEIKDAAAYLRLAVNPRSDADLERAINVPPRGIGDTTVERLRSHAQARGMSLYEALGESEQVAELNAGARRRLLSFRDLLDRLGAEARAADGAGAAVSAVLERTNLLQMHADEGSEESLERAENLREFVGAALEFDRVQKEAKTEQTHAPGAPSSSSASADGANLPTTPTSTAALASTAAFTSPSPSMSTSTSTTTSTTSTTSEPAPTGGDEAGALRLNQSALEAFLEQISLLGDADAEDGGGRVSLMTLHAAKGLEFDAAVLTGMEENVFPHSRAIEGGFDPEEMAEERRLCYVGITRARRRLCFSLARSRALFGDLKFNEPSRFLTDVPKELFRFSAPGSTPARPRPPTGEHYIERDDGFDLDDGDGFVQSDDYDQRPEEERQVRRPAPRPAAPAIAVRKRPNSDAPAVGSRVRHEKFGEGLVISASGAGMRTTVVVRFPGIGERRIDVRFLVPLGS